MKLKSSLAILSCAAISISISIPTIAYTEDIDIQSKSTSIRKKQLQTNNDRKNTGLVGLWKATVNLNGIPTDILCNFRVDGIEDCSYTNREGTHKGQGTWNYIDEKLYFSYETSNAIYSIQWISQDEFILRPTANDNGIQQEQRYYRQPIQTSQQNNQDKYGAFAVHAYGSYWGASWDHSTPEAARNAAMKSCFEVSRGKCTPAVTFKNGCGALATALARYGSAAGVDELSAQHKALEVCGGEFCKIKKVVCNS